MMRCLLKRRAGGDRGLAMVEFAIGAPLLALLMGGIVKYGTLWRDNLTVTSSTRAAADGGPHSSCFDSNGDPKNSSGYCNYYTGAEVAAMSSINCSVSCAEFPDNANCAGAMTTYFCPQPDRETDQASGLTSVGVWVRINRDCLTGLFPGDGVTITDQTVMKVEPR